MYMLLSCYGFKTFSKFLSVAYFLLSPYRTNHQLAHIDLIQIEWLILLCVFWIKYLEGRRIKDLLLLFIAAVFTGLTHFYLLF